MRNDTPIKRTEENYPSELKLAEAAAAQNLPSTPSPDREGLMSLQSGSVPHQGLLTVRLSWPETGMERWVGDTEKDPELWVLNAILQLMGGTSFKTRRVDERVERSFAVPLVVASSQAVDEKSFAARVLRDDIRFSGEPVLYVEDQELNRVTVKRLLEEVGLKVRACKDGQDGLSAFKEFAVGVPFACVITDLRMPVMSGQEMIREIREVERERKMKMVPIIILTGVSAESYECTNLPGLQIVRKPVSKQGMVEAVYKAVVQRNHDSRTREELLMFKRKIMIVDDDPVASRITAHCLRRLGHPSIERNGVKEAVQFYKANHDALSMILQDNMLKDGTGVQCIKEIRKFEEDERIVPNVVVVSVSGISADQQKEDYDGLGVADYLVKPVSINDLELVVSHFLD